MDKINGAVLNVVPKQNLTGSVNLKKGMLGLATYQNKVVVLFFWKKFV